MKVTVVIECDGAVFEENGSQEVARILARCAEYFERGDRITDGNGLKLRDINGNTVGSVEVTE